jgi:hypothetical protein
MPEKQDLKAQMVQRHVTEKMALKNQQTHETALLKHVQQPTLSSIPHAHSFSPYSKSRTFLLLQK